jgi:hypothetical protein
MKVRFLIWLTKGLKKNKDKDYVQTWYYMPKRKWFPWTRRLLQFFCGIIGGHELSKTEWGYGGGEYADAWCRWCDQMFEVPKESVYFKSKNARNLIKGFNHPFEVN